MKASVWCVSLYFISVISVCTLAKVVSNEEVIVQSSVKQFSVLVSPAKLRVPLCKEEYLKMSCEKLYYSATEGRKVGGCSIGFGGPGTFCDLYVTTATLGAPHGSGHYRGWPRTTTDRGTGCVKAPDYPKGMSHCFFNSPQYDLTAAERASFCTESGKNNSVAQLRHAIEHDQCNLKSCMTPTPTPTPSPTPSPDCKKYYLSLPACDLYRAATEGRKVGGCSIGFGGPGTFCDLYVTTATLGAPHGSGHYRGWPRTTTDRGTGCVKAPDYPKGMSHCFFNSPQYDLTAAERASFCTESGKNNSVAQLRHAIEHDQCDITSCEPLPSPRPSPKPSCPCLCYRSIADARAACAKIPHKGLCGLQRCSWGYSCCATKVVAVADTATAAVFRRS